MADIIDNTSAKRGRGRPKKQEGTRQADLPDAVLKRKQVEREESGESWGVTDTSNAGKYMQSTISMWKLPPIDIDKTKQVEERIEWYFNHCGELELKPSVAGLAVALGVDRTTIYRWSKGELRNTPEHRNLIKRAVEMILYNTEIYAQDGKMNPAIAIFLLKNHGGYTDVQQLTVEAKQQEFEERKMSDVLEEFGDIPEADTV